MHKKYFCSDNKNDDMYSKTAHSEKRKKSKNHAECSIKDKPTRNSSKEPDTNSRERTKRNDHHQNRNNDKVQKKHHSSKEKRENVSNHSEKKSSRTRDKAEGFVKEITINNNLRIKHAENLENVHKIRKHCSRSSENFNQSPKVKPEHLRREKTIHVEKIRKTSQNKPDPQNIKCMKEKKHDDTEIKRRRHKSSGEKKLNRTEFGDQQLLYCQVETTSPFRKLATNDKMPSNIPVKIHKEKVHKEVKNTHITGENISKINETKKDIFSADIPNARVHHKKNRPKLIVGRKPLKYSILEPTSSSDNRKNRKHNKKEINSQKDSQVKKNKKQSPAENNSKNISTTQPQFQDKIEDDLKSYFTRIQSLIDKKIDALLQNYKSKIKLKEASEEEIVEPTARMDNDINRHHRHRSKSRKKVSRKGLEIEKHEAKLKGVDRMEKRFNNPVERNCDIVAAPTRHSSPRKYAVSPRFNSLFWRNHEEMQRCLSPPPRNQETRPQRSSPLIKSNEIHRQCSFAGTARRNEGSPQPHYSADRRKVASPQRHNSPIDRRYESYRRRSSSSGRNYEIPQHHYSPVRGYCETSRMPSHHNQCQGKNSEISRQHNSIFDGIVEVSHCRNIIKDVKDKNHTSSKNLSNYQSAVFIKELDKKNSNVNRYIDHEELNASGCIPPSKHTENKVKNKLQKNSYFRVEGIEPAKLLESGNKTPKKRVSRNLECKTVSIIGIPSQMKKHSFRNVGVAEDSVERKKKTKRFKLYYQYSRDDNNFYPDSANSSEGKSVISDSLRVISDESECHMELCTLKKEIKKQSGSTKYVSSKTYHKPSDQSCMFSKRSAEGNGINREPGKYRHKASVDSKLNNIIEERTSVSSSGEPRKLNLEIDCKYFKALHSSSSDYNVRSKNERIDVNERKEQAVPIKYEEVNNDFKSKRKRCLTNDSTRKMHNTKIKRKEQKAKLISKSDVDISYNSLIEIKSIESRALQKYASRECSGTAKTVDVPKGRDCSLNIAKVKGYNEPQKCLNWWKTDKQKDEMKEYLQNLQQTYFGIGTRLLQNDSVKEALNEIDNSTGFGEVNKKSSVTSNKDDEQNSSLLRKIYNLIENQNREISDTTKSNVKEEKEVQAVCNKQDEEITTKDLQSQHSNFENQYSAEQNDGMHINKFIKKDVIIQKTSARDVGTEMDKNSFKSSEANVNRCISGHQNDVMSQNIIDMEVQESLTEKHTRCVSTTQIRKRNIAVDVDITEMLEHRHKDAYVQSNIKRLKAPREKSSINQFSKPNEEHRPKSVSHRKRRDRHEVKKKQSIVWKDARNEHTHGKPNSAKTSTLANKEEVHEIRSNSCDSKSTVKSKLPTSKKHVSNPPVNKKSKTEEKLSNQLSTQLCDGCDASSKLKQSQSEISFRNMSLDNEESKITSLVCLHKYLNVIKYETSSKSNSHSLDHYPHSEQLDRSTLFLTKDYRTPEVSAYIKRKKYDESMRMRNKRKAGNQSKSNLAPQVYEVRFLTVDNLHRSLEKNKTTIENNILKSPPEYAYNSNMPKCFFEGSFNKTNLTKTNMTRSKLFEYYQQIVDRQGSCLSYERSNIIINEGKSLNFQGNYEHCLPGQKDVGNFLDCLCKHLLSNKFADSFPEIDESFKKIWSMCDKINLKGDVPTSQTTVSPKEEKTADSVNVSEEDNITDLILSDEDPVHDIDEEFVDDTEYLLDRKLVITGNLSCPIIRAPDSSFDYLYQTGSSDKLSNMGNFVGPRKPVNTILGFALNRNTSLKRLKPRMKNSLVELDLEAPHSVESGYSSTKSKNNLSFTNFFKKPNIAALMEPQNDNYWFCSDENINLKESISSTPRFTDYKKMTKQCQEYAQKVTQYSKTKISVNEVYEEIPLEKLLGKRNRPNLIKFRSDSSILEKKIEAERKESIQSDPMNSIPSGKQRYIHENVEHNVDFYQVSLPCGDYIQNKNNVSVIYENMASTHTCHVKGDDTKEDRVHENQVMKSESTENVELIKDVSKTDMELLQKILDSQIILSSTNLNTCCITIVESQNFDEIGDCKNTLSGNEDAVDTFKLSEEWNERKKPLSKSDLLDNENSRKFKRNISKKFFENLLEVYEKEIAISSALLQDNDFLENDLLSLLGENNEIHAATKKKLTVKNRIKMFIRNVFSSKNRRETKHVFYQETEKVENPLTPVDADYQEKLQSLASGAHKYFSMFVRAVEHNHEINDEIKICGLLKLLERIENGHFRFLRGEETVNFKEEIKQQIKQAFIEIYYKAAAEAEMMRRKLSSNDIQLIATFVCKYRIGLLSRTDIIASYIGKGFLRTDQQLKDAVISLMKQPDIDLQEFQTYSS